MFSIPSKISGRLTISSLEGLRRETSFCRIVSDTSYSISSLINSMAKTYNTCIIFYSTTKILLLIYMYMWYWMIQSIMFNWQMINDTLCTYKGTFATLIDNFALFDLWQFQWVFKMEPFTNVRNIDLFQYNLFNLSVIGWK